MWGESVIRFETGRVMGGGYEILKLVDERTLRRKKVEKGKSFIINPCNF